MGSQGPQFAVTKSDSTFDLPDEASETRKTWLSIIVDGDVTAGGYCLASQYPAVTQIQAG
jgi:hypothetical protein